VEVIPLASADAIPFVFPDQCRECGTTLEKFEQEAVTRCPNPQCRAVVRGTIEHWVSRDALDIPGIGEKLIAQLVNQKLVQNVLDLYRLDLASLLALDRMGQKSATKLLQAIEASKQKPWERVLYGLGIRHVGLVTAQLLSQHFSPTELLEATPEQISSIHGIGPEIAQSVVEWCRCPAHRDLIAQLQDLGFNLAPPPALPRPLTGKTFVITGTLPTLSRSEAKALIQAQGGKVTESVSQHTNYLVAGEKPGSKLAKAQKLGIPILDEAQLLKLVSNPTVDL
jgi:NAD-dependent DNA ligase (contains BRCT domain type II)